MSEMGDATNPDSIRCVHDHDIGEKEWVAIVGECARDLLFELKRFREKLRFFLRSHHTWFPHVSETVIEMSAEIDAIGDEMTQLFVKSEKYRHAYDTPSDYAVEVEDWSDSEFP